MKECKYCGTKYDDSLSVCPNCGGTKVVTVEEQAEEAAFKKREAEIKERFYSAPETHKNRLIGILAGAVVTIIAIIAVASVIANKPLSNGMTKDEGDQVLTEGIAFFDAGDYEAAMKCFAQLPADSKQYEKAQEMLDKCADEYSTAVIEKANTYATNGEYEVALNLLDSAGELLPDNTPIAAARNAAFAEYKDAVCTKAISAADEYVVANDYPAAISVLTEATSKIGSDSEVNALLTQYTNSYVDSVVLDAEQIYKPYSIDALNEATAIISNALSVLPNNNELQMELANYKDLQPVSLMDMTTDNSSLNNYSYQYEYAGEKQDSLGNTYLVTLVPSDWTESSHPYGWDGGPWARAQWAWLLDYQYSRVTGTFAFDGHYKSSPVEIALAISKATNEGWNSQKKYTLTSSSGFLKFDVDLTGAKSVEFYIEQNEKGGTYLFLTDVYFWK